MAQRNGDTRAERTRRTIVEAFNRLVLDRSGESIRVADVIDAAGVGRSTFYEHFRNIDDLHTDAARFLLEALADGVTADDGASRIAHVLTHMREHRRIARATLNGGAAAPYARRLGELIEERLRAQRRGAAAPRVELAATAAAAAQLALIRVWLDSPATVDAAVFASAVRDASRGAASGLLRGPDSRGSCEKT